MGLPTINHPIHKIEVPSINKQVQFRPFTVKEEKILLTAQESNDEATIMSSLAAVIGNCCLEDVATDLFTTFDVEWLFMQLRSISVSNIIQVKYKDNEDEQVRTFDIDISNIELKNRELLTAKNNTIDLDADNTLKLRYPAARFGEALPNDSTPEQIELALIRAMLDSLYTNDEVYQFDQYSEEEVDAFINNLPISALDKIKQFVSDIPYLYYKIEYTNNKGNNREIEMLTVFDFFIWV